MASDSASITVHAPAKINLALAVGPPEADGPKRGFHPITSWFVTTTLCDTLTLRRRAPGDASTHMITWAADAPKPSPIDWPIERDLAVRAHRLLETHVGHALPLHMTLGKRIPVGGGLGGGSSDAAAALIAINALFALGLDVSTLADLGQRLGSDIAFFIDDDLPPWDEPRRAPRPALVTGFGERISRLPRRPLPPALLLIPAFGCPTGPVYQAFDELLVRRKGKLTVTHDPVIFAASHWMNTGMVDQRLLQNGLTDAACKVVRELEQTIDRLSRGLGVPIHVTGSGSTMFVVGGPGIALPALARDAARLDPSIVAVPVELC